MIKHTVLTNNLYEVKLENVIVYFSYDTIIAFAYKGKLTVFNRGDWSMTTRRHINRVAGLGSGDIEVVDELASFDNLLGDAMKGV